MDYKSRIKDLIKEGRELQISIIASFILIGIFFLGLGIGLLVKPNKPNPIIIDKNIKIGLPAGQTKFSQNSVNLLNFTRGNFVASINGKAYYPKNCKAANVIKEENRIWFESAKEAETDGYALAKNCP